MDAQSESGSDSSVVYDLEEVKLHDLTNLPISASWGMGNTLFVWNTAPIPTINKPGLKPKLGVKPQHMPVLALSWNRMIGARKLALESHAVFINTRRLRTQTITTSKLLFLSQQYRSILKMLTSTFDPNLHHQSDIEKELQTYEVIEMIWHIAEVLIFDSSPVLPGLLDWIQTHFSPHPSNEFSRVCSNPSNNTSISSHPEYWPSIFAYAMRGQIHQVNLLLSVHPNVEDPIFTQILELLKTIPSLSLNINIENLSILLQNHNNWQLKVQQLLRRSDLFSGQPAELRTFLLLISGDLDTLLANSSHWAIFIVALVLYVHPASQVQDLRHFLVQVEQIIQEYPDEKFHPDFTTTIAGLPTQVDELVKSIFDLELEEILVGVLEFGNPWFAAHFVDILSACDNMPFKVPQRYDSIVNSSQDEENITNNNKDGESYHELAITEYITSASVNQIPIRIMADYLAACPIHGRSFLIQLVAQQPLSTEKEASKMLSLCNTFVLTEPNGVNTSILKTMVSKRIKRRQFAAAIAWSKGHQAQQLFDQLLDQVVLPFSTLTFEDKNLENLLLPSSVSVTSHLRRVNLILTAISSSGTIDQPSLQFLKLYSEMLQSYFKQNWPLTIDLIQHSMTTEAAPMRFWLMLLKEIVLLMAKSTSSTFSTANFPTLVAAASTLVSAQPSDNFVCSSRNVHQAMHCLELAKNKFPESSRNVEAIRTALVHQLQIAIMSEV